MGEQVGDLKIGHSGKGSYILLPPSLHPSGKTYVFAAGADLDDIDPPELEDKFICAAHVLDQAGRLSDPVSAELCEGARNSGLTKIAGGKIKDVRDLNDQVEIDAARLALHNVNDCRCSPPLPASDVDVIFNSILTAERSRRPADGKRATIDIPRPSQFTRDDIGNAPDLSRLTVPT